MTAWLSIVGIGDDGPAGLPPAARTLVETAEVLVASKRHLARLADAPNGQERIAWTSPLAEMTERVLTMRGRRVTVLASGDPLHYGIGATIAGRLAPEEVTIVPHVSSFALAAARLVWPLDRVTLLSVHGRPIERVAPHIAPDARLLILAHDGHTPRRIATMLADRGFGDSRMSALAHMGGDMESRTTALAREWSAEVPDLHVLAVECVAGTGARWLPRIAGLPDEAFEHDGKLTKRELRALALAKLMPHRGAALWDVGAGCGSIGIEWMRAADGAMAIALEPRAERRAMTARNAAALGVPELDIRDAHAPEGLADLPVPDAVFVGGGVSEATVAMSAERLKPGGRLVAHAVTLESEAVLLRAYKERGGTLTRLSAAHAEPIGSFTGWRPAMPVTQWAWVKSGGEVREQRMSGRLYGVGVGPGDPELMTLKAVRVLAQAPVIAYPAPAFENGAGESSARRIAAAHIPAGRIEIAIRVPMRPGPEPASIYDDAAEAIAAHLEAGRDVAVLCEGDPLFYGSFVYLHDRLAHRFPTTIVPGVSSLTACAASAKRALVRRDLTLTVLPATLPDASLEARIAATDAAAILKVGRHLPRLKALLARLGLADTSTYVAHATRADERVVALADLAAEDAPYFSMILVAKEPA